ncbi:AAA family ATPase [Halobacillus salinus]|uniref:AAA family ATPase n=1 Tax=Halobacillus salinus TaxID=192814 RepID=UPI0009A5D790|nr:AAA family ATPase [Halobacillus salinus]
MIVMINGAFGVGKTTVAESLQSQLPNSIVYDPEVVGFFLRELLPEGSKQLEAPSGNFQDYVLWREYVVKVARSLVDTYDKHLIVPMTIYNYDYFNYIRGGFEDICRTDHYCLKASRETIETRLLKRGEEKGNWCFQQIEHCLESFSVHDFSTYISTDNRHVAAVVEEINRQSSLELTK